MSNLKKEKQMDRSQEGKLLQFIRESNKIEGIITPPTGKDLEVFKLFLSAPLYIKTCCDFVAQFEPKALLRDKIGLNVYVGSHVQPRGGKEIRALLFNVLEERDPWKCHCLYEDLHPFTDCNGRSGRAVWLKKMLENGNFPSLGFLHTFYYQTLAQFRS